MKIIQINGLFYKIVGGSVVGVYQTLQEAENAKTLVI